MAKGSIVAVAMSGGVDSSVAAAVLLEKGYQPFGLTMRLWVDPRYEEQTAQGCCSLEDVQDARRVADHLGIAHYTLNMKDEFRQEVVDNFIKEYCLGRTPNPCVVCNAKIKFGSLLNKIEGLEASALATGHYVRKGWDNSRGRYYLQKGVDPSKDQSYTLYHLTQEQLGRALFPLGDLHKEQVRQKAYELDLPVAEKGESQEVCFIPGNDYREFLRSRVGSFSPGPIVDTSGNLLGEHKGLPYYTIGQRRGLGITASEPLYVIEIRSEDNTLVVGSHEETYHKGLIASSLNFIAREEPEEPMEVNARIRYQASEVPAILYPPDNDGNARLLFHQPQRAVTPGQSVVFYISPDIVLGGGIITSSL